MTPISISFCIRTNRKKEWKLISLIASLLALEIDPDRLEILVAGDTDFAWLDGEMAKRVRLLPDPQSAHGGRTSVMMNRMAREARHPWICFSDDDIFYCDGWYEKVCRFLSAYPQVDMCSFPLRNVDGSRFWDWAIHENGKSTLIDPRSADQRLYVTGGLVLLRRALWEADPWDESRGYYQGEDTEWSQRLIAAGATVALCTAAYAVHNDWRYLQVGHAVIRAAEIGEAQAVAERPQANAAYGQYLRGATQAMDGLRVFLDGLGRQTLPSLDPTDKARLAELIRVIGEMEGEIGQLSEIGKKLAALAV